MSAPAAADGVVFDDASKSHAYANADALRDDADPRRNSFWRSKSAGALISIRFYFHDPAGSIDIGWRSPDGLARVARVLACERVMRHCDHFDVPMRGVVPSLSSLIPRASDDLVADVERLQRAIDHVFNGGNVAEVL